MIFTNKHNLPKPLAQAIVNLSRPRQYQSHVISVTELIGPPLIRQMRNHYNDVVEQDVSKLIYSVLGTAVHSVIHQNDSFYNDDKPEYHECQMSLEMFGWKITGQCDFLSQVELLDFKVTSIFAFLLGAKEEWIAQLNLYRYMAYKNMLCHMDIPMRIVAILRDWTQYQHDRDPQRVPPCAAMTVDVPSWTVEECEQFIASRLTAHQRAQDIGDTDGLIDSVELCSPKERWQSKTKYAVYKGTNKRATRVLDTMDEATKFAVENNVSPVRFEERPGTPVRCTRYCEFKDFCRFGKQLTFLEETE